MRGWRSRFTKRIPPEIYHQWLRFRTVVFSHKCLIGQMDSMAGESSMPRQDEQHVQAIYEVILIGTSTITFVVSACGNNYIRIYTLSICIKIL